METTDLKIISAEMPLLPPLKRRRIGSESSYEPDPNEADVSSNVSSEGNVYVETLAELAPIRRKAARGGKRKVVKTYKARRSYRYASGTPKLQQIQASRSSRSRSREVRPVLKVKDRVSPQKASTPPATDILNSGELSIAPSATFTSRRLTKINPVRYGFVSHSEQTAEAQDGSTKIQTSDSIHPPKHHRDQEDSCQQSEYRSVPKSPSPGKAPEKSGPQDRIAELEKENIILEEENATLRAQVDELCSRIGEVGSNSLETTIVKDDVFFENGFINLNKMIRDFVREFLQSKFTSPFSPSKVPTKIRDILNFEGTEWQKHLRGGKNRKVLRAIAQKYISFYLVENIIIDPVFRHNRQLQDAFSTIQTVFPDHSVRSRWRNRTIQELRSTLPEPLSDDLMVELKSKELFRDTRVLWVKYQEKKEAERLRRITGYALKLATELHKLPYEIQYGFSRDNWDKLPRDIDTHPEKEFYHINVHSRHSNFQFMTVFPGIRKLSRTSGPGEDEDSGIIYLPLQLSAYD